MYGRVTRRSESLEEFADAVNRTGFQRRQFLAEAAGTVDLDIGGFGRDKAEMDSEITLGKVAAAAPHFIHLPVLA